MKNRKREIEEKVKSILEDICDRGYDPDLWSSGRCYDSGQYLLIQIKNTSSIMKINISRSIVFRKVILTKNGDDILGILAPPFSEIRKLTNELWKIYDFRYSEKQRNNQMEDLLEMEKALAPTHIRDWKKKLDENQK